MKKIAFSLVFFVLIVNCVRAQNTDLEQIEKLIYGVFDDMRNADKSSFQSKYIDTASLTNFSYSLLNIKSKKMYIKDFVRQFDNIQRGDLDERIEKPLIHVDDFYASAWVPYTFYYKGELSHCGVNNFSLLREGNRWKIAGIQDTRRENCAGSTQDALKKEISTLIDKWHHAAAVADEQTYFAMMKPGGVFIGTDPSERWTVEEFERDVADAFKRESAWDFTPYNRMIHLNESKEVAWWDELLDTWMGVCRGSGVVEKVDDRWVIKHYQLSVTVYNDDIQEFLKMAPKRD